MAGIRTKLTITGDRDMFPRTAGRLRSLQPFMRQVGNLAVSSALGRLPLVLKMGGGVRSGNLANSICVFEATGEHVVIGSNLVYAAQVQYGGTILPRNAKTLAIPLDVSLQRDGIGPREYPGVLQFRPVMTAKPNVMGLLIDKDTDEAKYALAYWVTQQPRPYLYWSDQDVEDIGDLWAAYVAA